MGVRVRVQVQVHNGSLLQARNGLVLLFYTREGVRRLRKSREICVLEENYPDAFEDLDVLTS